MFWNGFEFLIWAPRFLRWLIGFMFSKWLFWLDFLNLDWVLLFDCLMLWRDLLKSLHCFSASFWSCWSFWTTLMFNSRFHCRSFRSLGCTWCVRRKGYSTRFIWNWWFDHNLWLWRIYWLLNQSRLWFGNLRLFRFRGILSRNLVFVSIEKCL